MPAATESSKLGTHSARETSNVLAGGLEPCPREEELDSTATARISRCRPIAGGQYHSRLCLPASYHHPLLCLQGAMMDGEPHTMDDTLWQWLESGNVTVTCYVRGPSAGTYFVGRNELLQWINSTLDLQLSKIEQVGHALLYSRFACFAPPSIQYPLCGWHADCVWSCGLPAPGISRESHLT